MGVPGGGIGGGGPVRAPQPPTTPPHPAAHFLLGCVQRWAVRREVRRHARVWGFFFCLVFVSFSLCAHDSVAVLVARQDVEVAVGRRVVSRPAL